MPTAYTPGLRITEDMLVRRERRLPIKGEVLVEQHALVTPQTIIARAMLEGHLHSFKAAEKLGVAPSELKEALKKQVGDEVEEGELLAEIKGLFGLFRSECRAPVKGKIEHISATSGFIAIRQPPRPIEVDAYLSGEVTEILPDEGIIIQTRAAFVQGIFGVSGERFGPLHIACNAPDEPLSADNLKEEMRGGVIIGGSHASAKALRKAAEVGAVALVVGALSDSDLRQYVGYDIGVAITGQEQLPFTLILTEGFGQIPMAERTFRLLSSLEGKMASVNGATQIRAGVIRPEIVIPHEDSSGTSDINEAQTTISSELAPGVKVRIIREPYLGKIGLVIALPPDLQTIQTGAKVRVASISISEAEEVIVPRANLEIIQE